MKRSRRAKKIPTPARTSSLKPERPPKFNLSDWVVTIITSLLLLGGLAVGAYFGIMALVQNQLSGDSSVESISLDFDEALFNRGSEILDIYVNKKSAVILFVDGPCIDNEICSEYIDVVLDLMSVMRDDTPDIFLFNVDSARSKGDTNVDSVISRAKVDTFPTLVLIRDGIETFRYVGSDIEGDALYDLFISNNLIDEDLLEELLNSQEE